MLDPWRRREIYFYYRGTISSRVPRACASIRTFPSGLIALEYWFYYPYNYYPLVVNDGLMNEAPIAGDDENIDLHQGDWEHVDVLLDPPTHAPQWLYLARHSDEGQFIPWNSPQIAFDQGHPVLQAAFGGHPTYLAGCGARPRPMTYDFTSDWLSCGSGRFAFRAATTPLVDIAPLPWACWPGYFGEASTKLEVQNAEQARERARLGQALRVRRRPAGAAPAGREHRRVLGRSAGAEQRRGGGGKCARRRGESVAPR